MKSAERRWHWSWRDRQEQSLRRRVAWATAERMNGSVTTQGASSASYHQYGCFLPVQVMVWIHGGGLVLGGAPMYDGVVLAAHENVVVVAIQYRLGIWGFFR